MKKYIKFLCLLLLLIIPIGIQAASQEKTVTKCYQNWNDVDDEITIEDNIKIPFYSMEKEDNGYMVTYSNKPFTEESAHSRGMITYEKTVTKAYYQPGDFEESTYYSEYNDTYRSYFSGTLYLESMVKQGSLWIGTYRGTLCGSGL